MPNSVRGSGASFDEGEQAAAINAHAMSALLPAPRISRA